MPAARSCVIVRDGGVVASGSNSPNVTRNATRHAELEAVDALLSDCGGSEAEARFGECELFVTVEPCIMCAAALSLLRFRRVVFGAANDRFGGCGSVLDVGQTGAPPCGGGRGGGAPLLCEGGLYSAEAVELLRSFYVRGNPNAPKPHRTLRLDLDVERLGRPREKDVAAPSAGKELNDIAFC